MTSVLLDTNAYAAFKRGHADAVAVIQHAPEIVLNTVVLGELLGGFSAGSREQQNREELDAFLASPRVRVAAVDALTARRYASIYAALRRAATPIPTNDMWIAASALQHGLRVFTYDAHFQHVPGLTTGTTIVDFEVP